MKKEDRLIFDLPEKRLNAAHYMWTVFSEATNLQLEDLKDAPLRIHEKGAFPVSESFDALLDGHISAVASKYNLPEGLPSFIEYEPVACIFYLLNGLHEHLLPPRKADKYGRYPYEESIQFVNGIIEENLVQTIFNQLYEQLTGLSPQKRDTRLFWTHDIDYLYSAWKSDLIMAFRNPFSHALSGLRNAVSFPSRWNNISDIVKLENKYGIKSVFFWLTQQGKAAVSENQKIDHADYHMDSDEIKRYWDLVLEAGSCHGLHKSAFDRSFREEIVPFPRPVHINRHHFLKFRLPDLYDQIEKAGFRYDASLGFAEHYGFRNSFGRPFRPYNLRRNRPYKFVEYPLHIMDATFIHYLKLDQTSMLEKIRQFIHRHSDNAILGLLFHNSSFNFRNSQQVQTWNRFFESLSQFESEVQGGG